MKKVIFLELEEDKKKFLQTLNITNNIDNLYIDIIGKFNVILFYINDKIYVCGIKHLQLNCLFTKEEVVDIIKKLLSNNIIYIKNSRYLISSINDSNLLSNILDVHIFIHYCDNRNFDTEISSIYLNVKKERHHIEKNFSKKVNSSVLTIYNLIEASSEYNEYFNLKQQSNVVDNFNKFKECVSNFNFLNKLSTNGIYDNLKLENIQYTINSITKRPSLLSKINYFSLSKKDNSRESITSRYENGILVEIDFQSYHLQLLDLYLHLFIDKKNDFNYHLEFFNIVHNKTLKETLSIEEKSDIKKKIFYTLYNIDYINNWDSDVIRSINNFKAKVLEEYNLLGYIKSLYSTGNIYFDENVTYNKIINYAIQDLETNINLRLLKNFYTNFENKYNLILYVYDSFVFDIKQEDLDVFLVDIKNVFKQFIFSIKTGKNYNNLENLH
jgi:hypothetical protein